MQNCVATRVRALTGLRGVHLQQRPVIPRYHVSLQQQRLVCRAQKGDELTKQNNKQEEYVEALKKGGVDQKTAQRILERWQEAGAVTDPSQLRKLFLKQSLVPITASVVQLLFDLGAAYSCYMTAGFFALSPVFFGRTALVLLLDFLAVYFAFGLLFDIITLTSVLITTVRLGTTPVAFVDAVKSIAAPAGSSSVADSFKIVEKAKAAVSAVKVAQALDAIAGLLETSLAGKLAAGVDESSGQAMKSTDTLANLSAYLTLYRAEAQAGFDPASVGMSESEAANIALVFGEYDLDDNGRLDINEFVKMVATLGTNFSRTEAEAALEVIDANKDGFITFDEFATWWSARKKSK
eukprot:GHRQ01001906.1.p1 GENE.GHRQ01001906.1~~GHRQ01001906.1.p1  ORF type:complete len:351 (+),score=150.42 GHRQ01001906.1:100-1152(+)